MMVIGRPAICAAATDGEKANAANATTAGCKQRSKMRNEKLNVTW